LGTSLSKQPLNEESLPYFLQFCFGFLDDDELMNTDEIWKGNKSSGGKTFVFHAIEKNMNKKNYSIPKETAPSSVVYALYDYFSHLPSPIIPCKHFVSLTSLFESDIEEDTSINILKTLFSTFPVENRSVLYHLFKLLYRYSAQGDHNNEKYLSKIWQPFLLFNKSQSKLKPSKRVSPLAIKCIRFTIVHFNSIFSDGELFYKETATLKVVKTKKRRSARSPRSDKDSTEESKTQGETSSPVGSVKSHRGKKHKKKKKRIQSSMFENQVHTRFLLSTDSKFTLNLKRYNSFSCSPVAKLSVDSKKIDLFSSSSQIPIAPPLPNILNIPLAPPPPSNSYFEEKKKKRKEKKKKKRT